MPPFSQAIDDMRLAAPAPKTYVKMRVKPDLPSLACQTRRRTTHKAGKGVMLEHTRDSAGYSFAYPHQAVHTVFARSEQLGRGSSKYYETGKAGVL